MGVVPLAINRVSWLPSSQTYHLSCKLNSTIAEFLKLFHRIQLLVNELL